MKSKMYLLLALLFLAGQWACGPASDSKSTASVPLSAGIQRVEWGRVDDKPVYLYTLTNKKGVQVKISNYGGTITYWAMPDKLGHISSIVLGFDSLSGYLAKPPYFGATIGRYGNRIANGRFKIEGKEFILAQNNGKNALHGGLKGFDKVVWDAEPTTDSISRLTLDYLSRDGEEGYPGNLKVKVQFTLSDEDELSIEYFAETDQTTPVNLTNHSYFNLTGDVSNTILNHNLMILADKYTPVDSTLIPTGEQLPVTGTPFDFSRPASIGSRIDQVKGGYDHNFVINGKGDSLQMVAVLTDSLSGRKLEVFSKEPGLQFYSGNFLDGTIKTDNGTPIKQHSALCLETQHFPNSPNQASFPNTFLKPGEKYHSLTKYKVVLF